MNSSIRCLLLTGFTVVMVNSAAQSQAQPDNDAVKTESGVIYVQPLARGSGASKPIINLLSLKGMSSLMSYDAKMGSTASMGPLRFDYSTPNSGTKTAKTDPRDGRLGIEQAERMNLMQMNDYRWRSTTTPSSSTTEKFYPSVTERMFNTR